MQNDRATVQILTETASAAHLIGENEGRLAQLMESSGLKLGTLNSSLNQQAGSDSFGKQNGQKDENSISQKKTSDKIRSPEKQTQFPMN